jgi:PKD repeat protein
VSFGIGSGCGPFDYGYTTTAGATDTAPTAKASATPTTAAVNQKVTLSAAGSTDAETPNNLTYSWDFDNGGTTKDATGKTATVSYSTTGVKHPKLTVSDPQGKTGTAAALVTVTKDGAGPHAVIRVKPKHPGTDRKTRFVGKKSTGVGKLHYKWNFHNGGKKVDARGKKVKTFFRNAGRHKVTLTVTDSTGASDKASARFRVRHHFTNRVSADRATPAQLYRLLF